MFGIGFWESMAILLIIIVMVKPDDIPAFVHKVGKVFGKLRQSYDMLVENIRNLESKVKDEIDDIASLDDKKSDNVADNYDNDDDNDNDDDDDDYEDETYKYEESVKSSKRKAGKIKKTVKPVKSKSGKAKKIVTPVRSKVSKSKRTVKLVKGKTGTIKKTVKQARSKDSKGKSKKNVKS